MVSLVSRNQFRDWLQLLCAVERLFLSPSSTELSSKIDKGFEQRFRHPEFYGMELLLDISHRNVLRQGYSRDVCRALQQRVFHCPEQRCRLFGPCDDTQFHLSSSDCLLRREPMFLSSQVHDMAAGAGDGDPNHCDSLLDLHRISPRVSMARLLLHFILLQNMLHIDKIFETSRFELEAKIDLGMEHLVQLLRNEWRFFKYATNCSRFLGYARYHR